MQEAEAIKVKVGDWTISAYSLQQESQRQILFTPRENLLFPCQPLPRAGFTGFVILRNLCYKPRSWHRSQ